MNPHFAFFDSPPGAIRLTRLAQASAGDVPEFNFVDSPESEVGGACRISRVTPSARAPSTNSVGDDAPRARPVVSARDSPPSVGTHQVQNAWRKLSGQLRQGGAPSFGPTSPLARLDVPSLAERAAEMTSAAIDLADEEVVVCRPCENEALEDDRSDVSVYGDFDANAGTSDGADEPATEDESDTAEDPCKNSQRPHSSTSGATAPRRASSSHSARRRGSANTSASLHLKKLRSTGLTQFHCGCKLSVGRRSCLTKFTYDQLNQFFQEAYGREGNASKSEVTAAVHGSLWALRKPLKHKNVHGHTFFIDEWKLAGQVVCKAAWIEAHGFTETQVRTRLQLTLTGIGPLESNADELARRVVRKVKQHGSAAFDFAVKFWLEEFMCHDFMPNEHTIQVRGPAFAVVHESLYLPRARQVKLALRFKQFMRAQKKALAIKQEDILPNHPPRTLKFKRSAKHSKFPECTKCQELRGEYYRLAKTPGVDPDAVAKAMKNLMDHMLDWKGDREFALRLKFDCSNPDHCAIYFCDDKCGSHWLRLPVSETGRDSKRNAKALYDFCIQGNVVAGVDGINAFTALPPNVGTGANFGLSNFLLSVWKAYEKGRLKEHVRYAYRHTDGGSDNMAHVTNVFHWLLVYIGAFDRLTWFVFEAGHSHTELVDWLFSLLKGLFESPNAARVTPIGSFPELFDRIGGRFAKCKEATDVLWDFANWDFVTYFENQQIMDPKFSGIQACRAYKYEYNEEFWAHGCVTLHFKDNLSYQGGFREAEWGPIELGTKKVPSRSNPGTQAEVACNVTVPGGEPFILKPPDLRFEPRRAEYDAEKTESLGTMCAKISEVRGSQLSSTARAHWKCLSELHSKFTNAQLFPDLPQQVSADGHTFAFDGLPRKLLPILKELQRFPRPFNHDLFNEAPPGAFPSERAGPCTRTRMSPCVCNFFFVCAGTARAPAAAPAHAPLDRTEEEEGAALRDPRRVNHLTSGRYPQSQRARDDADLSNEEWAVSAPAHCSTVEVTGLYLLRIEEYEGEYNLGLAIVDRKDAKDGEQDAEDTWSISWFTRTAWKARKEDQWGDNPVFEPHKVGPSRGARRATDSGIKLPSFILRVEDSDLTAQGRAVRTHAVPFVPPKTLHIEVHTAMLVG